MYLIWIKNESIAKLQLQQTLQTSINDRVLYIDQTCTVFGESPDGVIDSNTIVEIKCLHSARDLTPKEAIIIRNITFDILMNGGIKFSER